MKVLLRTRAGTGEKMTVELGAMPREKETIEMEGDLIFAVARVIWFDLNEEISQGYAGCLMGDLV